MALLYWAKAGIYLIKWITLALIINLLLEDERDVMPAVTVILVTMMSHGASIVLLAGMETWRVKAIFNPLHMSEVLQLLLDLAMGGVLWRWSDYGIYAGVIGMSGTFNMMWLFALRAYGAKMEWHTYLPPGQMAYPLLHTNL